MTAPSAVRATDLSLRSRIQLQEFDEGWRTSAYGYLSMFDASEDNNHQCAATASDWSIDDIVREASQRFLKDLLLKKGLEDANEYFKRTALAPETFAQPDLAAGLGVATRTLQRWQDQKDMDPPAGDIQPILHFAFFVSNITDICRDWTEGIVAECVACCVREWLRRLRKRTEKMDSEDCDQLLADIDRAISVSAAMDHRTVRLLDFIYRQKHSHRQLVEGMDKRGNKIGKELAFLKYVDAFLARQEREYRIANEEYFAEQQAQFLYCMAARATPLLYHTFLVINHLPLRAKHDVHRRPPGRKKRWEQHERKEFWHPAFR